MTDQSYLTLPVTGAEPEVVSLRIPTVDVSVWRRARVSMLRARWPLMALLILLTVTLLAIFGPQIAPKDPNRLTLSVRLQPPMEENRQGEVEYYLGTDALGRDVLSRLIYGARISLAVGFVAVFIGGTLGTLLGMVAGFFGGRVDDVIMRLADIQLAFPFILLAIMVLVVLGSGVLNLVLVLGIGQWVTYARIARGEAISQREKEYVEAARSIGSSNFRIMFLGILPNILPPPNRDRLVQCRKCNLG
jgi:peptide/nickel transport system permease protein